MTVKLLVLDTLLLALLSVVVGAGAAIAARTEGPFTIYSPAEVDCSQSFTDIDIIESYAGRQPASIFCSKLAQGDAFTLGELQVDQRRQESQLRQDTPWGSPYRVENYICRDRGSGYEVACFYPAAAEHLDWPSVQMP